MKNELGHEWDFAASSYVLAAAKLTFAPLVVTLSMDTRTDRMEHVRARLRSVTDSFDVESAGLSYVFVAACREHHWITIMVPPGWTLLA